MARAIAASLAADDGDDFGGGGGAAPPPLRVAPGPVSKAAPERPRARSVVSLLDDDDDDDYSGLVDNGAAASDDDDGALSLGAARPRSGGSGAAPTGPAAVAATAGVKRRRDECAPASSESCASTVGSADVDRRGATSAASGRPASAAPAAASPRDCVSSIPAALASPAQPQRNPLPPLPVPGPADVPPEPPAGAAGCTRMQLRLPDGARLIRRFAASETVAGLYAAAAAAIGRPHTLAGLYVRAKAASSAPVTPDGLLIALQSLVTPGSLQAGVDRFSPTEAALAALRSALPGNVSVAPLPPPPPQGGPGAGGVDGSAAAAGVGAAPAPLRLSMRVSAAIPLSENGTLAAPEGGGAVRAPCGGEGSGASSCFDHWDLGLPAPWVSLAAWGGATLAEAGLGAASTVVVRLLV